VTSPAASRDDIGGGRSSLVALSFTTDTSAEKGARTNPFIVKPIHTPMNALRDLGCDINA
jgi:hypothetical protein